MRDARSPSNDSSRTGHGNQLITGRLLAHGAANYQFRRDQDPSYYLKLRTDRGERIVWGKDLERALKSSATQPKIGDVVGAQRISREAVTLTKRQRDEKGVEGQTERLAHRNRWRVEKIKFFVERAKLARRVRDEQADIRDAMRRQPELRSTFLTERAATEFAARRIADPKDRERFLELVRGAIAGSIKEGAPLPSVQMREDPVNAPPINQRSKKDGPTR